MVEILVSGRRQLVVGDGITGLVDMLRYERATTLQSVDGLTPAELRHRHDEGSNPVGAFLWHVVEDEINHRVQIRWLRKRLPS